MALILWLEPAPLTVTIPEGSGSGASRIPTTSRENLLCTVIRGTTEDMGSSRLLGILGVARRLWKDLVVFLREDPAFVLKKNLAASASEDTEFLL